MAKIGAAVTLGRVGINQTPCCIDNNMMALSPIGEVNSRFLFYTLLAQDLKQFINPGAVPNLNMAMLRDLPLNCPPMSEQTRLAEFLDFETGKIDGFIADQERLIELLTERRRATIAYRLRETSPSDGSVALKHAGSIVLGKMLQGTPHDGDELRPYLRAANVQPDGALDLDNVKRMPFSHEESVRLDLRQNDVVVVEGGVGGYGRAAVIHDDLDGWGFQNSIVRIRPDDEHDGRFLAYALLELRASGYITMVASVASMPHFTAEKVGVAPIPHATLQEQKQAADDMDTAVGDIDAAITDAREAITLSKERRAALISAAVTGKIDVRDWKRPER